MDKMSLEERLQKIKSPNLQNQQHTAVVLSAVEETLTEQKTGFTATAYFAALLALLKQSLSFAQNEKNKELTYSVIYLLDIVSPHVPVALLRSQFEVVFSYIAPILTDSGTDAPLTKSSIGILESLVVAQDAPGWALPQSQPSPRQIMGVFLALAMDPRPKVRKRCLDAISEVLKRPAQGPALDHPAASMCASNALQNLQQAVQAATRLRKQQKGQSEGQDPMVMHALQLSRTIAIGSGGWPSKQIEPLCEILMAISRSSNEFLVMGAFDVFEVIFESMTDEVSSSKLPRLLDAIIELQPSTNDSQLLPPWIAVLSRGYGASAQVEPEETFAKLPDLFDRVASFLTSSSHNIRVSASECLMSFFANCIPDSAILEPSIYDQKILKELGQGANVLLSVKFQGAWMEVFKTLSAMLDAFRWQGDPYLVDVVRAIGELRGNESFHGKNEADTVLGHAIEALGPEAVLRVLPHNLIKPKSGQPGRAWLLPLLRDYVTNTNLAHFKAELVPLSEAMYQKVLQHGSAEKTMETKIFETIVSQVWAVFPGFCDLPLDLISSMDQPFAELISNLLYQQADLRHDLCRGLQNLVESNQAVLAAEIDDEDLIAMRRTSRTQAQENLDHMSKFASNLLAVLFNVYSQTLPQHRAYILQCINAYLSITSEKEVEATFDRVAALVESSMAAEAKDKENKSKRSTSNMPPTSHTLMDLIIALSMYLPRSAFQRLFALSSNLLTSSSIDPQLTKKAYKIIPRLSMSETGKLALKERNSELQALVLSTADQTPIPARRDRLLAIQTIVEHLPTSDLHFIPSILSEVVLACKDPNEKARQAGFTVLTVLAARTIDHERNPPGTKIMNSKVPGMPADAPDATATIEEVFTMTSAGLAGSTHMVAASASALSRLVFEHHSDLSPAFLTELLSTMEIFLESNNREIVRAVLGFVKVAIVVCPTEEVLRPRMPELTPLVVRWAKEHKGRLRSKIKSILERLIRKFGAGDVERWVPDSERKLVANIRKEKERRKRRKAQNEDEADGDAAETSAKTGKKSMDFDNEFDEAVYSSGTSDDDDDDDADEDMRDISFKSKKSTTNKQKSERFIREDLENDEPLDLLAPSSLANITSRKSVRFQPSSKPRSKARVDEDGKLIIGDNITENDEEMQLDHDHNSQPSNTESGGISAYLTAVSGPDAIRRGQKGRLKVSSSHSTKHRSGQRDDDGDDTMDLDEDEARAVAKKIMSSGDRKKLPPRKGLGAVGKDRGQQQGRRPSGGGIKAGGVQKRGAGGHGHKRKFREKKRDRR